MLLHASYFRESGPFPIRFASRNTENMSETFIIKRKQTIQGKPYVVCFIYVGYELSSRLVSKQVLLPLQSLTSVFGMGTGGPFAFETLTV